MPLKCAYFSIPDSHAAFCSNSAAFSAYKSDTFFCTEATYLSSMPAKALSAPSVHNSKAKPADLAISRRLASTLAYGFSSTNGANPIDAEIYFDALSASKQAKAQIFSHKAESCSKLPLSFISFIFSTAMFAFSPFRQGYGSCNRIKWAAISAGGR